VTSNRCTLRRKTIHLVFLRSVRRLLVAACVVPSSPIFVTLMKEVPPKRRFLQEPHGVTTQKTPFFIVTAVKTSNLTNTILVTLMMEALCSSETSVLTRGAWCNIPEDGILHSHCRKNLKSYEGCMLENHFGCVLRLC
jgi:hypothetical protein